LKKLDWRLRFPAGPATLGLALVLSVGFFQSGADAQDTLLPGPGSDITQAKCSICHEIQHVTRLRQSRDRWQDTLKTMVERGAPLAPEEINAILDYLSAYYGTAPPPQTAGVAQVDPVERLLNVHACAGCHAVDRQVIGPAFRDIAAKYRGDNESPARLSKKIREGGTGVWGNVPMPPNAELSDADAKLLVDWVLGRR
jgi:cytochrome c